MKGDDARISKHTHSYNVLTSLVRLTTTISNLCACSRDSRAALPRASASHFLDVAPLERPLTSSSPWRSYPPYPWPPVRERETRVSSSVLRGGLALALSTLRALQSISLARAPFAPVRSRDRAPAPSITPPRPRSRLVVAHAPPRPPPSPPAPVATSPARCPHPRPTSRRRPRRRRRWRWRRRTPRSKCKTAWCLSVSRRCSRRSRAVVSGGRFDRAGDDALP